MLSVEEFITLMLHALEVIVVNFSLDNLLNLLCAKFQHVDTFF